MNKNFLLYGALGFLVVRYFMKKRQNAAPIVSIPLPPVSPEPQIIEPQPVTPPYRPVTRRPDEPRDGFEVSPFTYPYENNPNSGSPSGDRRKQL
jgi:hypothetical protein